MYLPGKYLRKFQERSLNIYIKTFYEKLLQALYEKSCINKGTGTNPIHH